MLAVRDRAIDGTGLSPARFAALPAATRTFTSNCRSYSSHQQKTPDDAGALSYRRENSVIPHPRAPVIPDPVAAEAVVEADGDHIHVLADPVGEQGRNGRERGEVVVRSPHQQMIVFNNERPNRAEAQHTVGHR